MPVEHNPKLSIITCTLNSERFLPLALASVERQTYRNIEHIINDSFSTDSTLELIGDYIARNAHRYPIKLIHSEPGGVAKALNDATKHATGDLLHYLHSDVYYYDDQSLEKAVARFVANPDLVWITGRLVVLFKGRLLALPNTHLLKLNPEKALTFTNFISHENTFIRRDTILSSAGFNEDKNYNVEYSLWLNLIRYNQPLIVDEAFTVFIIHGGSTSTGSVYKFSRAVLRGFNTLRKERIFPLLGYYGDHYLYRQYKRFSRLTGF